MSSNSATDVSDITFGASTDQYPDSELLASSADCLRIWDVQRNDEMAEVAQEYESLSVRGGNRQREQRNHPFLLEQKCVLAHTKHASSPPAPLTSFSWNAPSPNLVVTSSIDTTCTIWDLPTRSALTQLIAHDREVYDVDWCPGSCLLYTSPSPRDRG